METFSIILLLSALTKADSEIFSRTLRINIAAREPLVFSCKITIDLKKKLFLFP